MLQEGGFTPASLTLLAIRVVLLHTLYWVLNPLIPQLYVVIFFYFYLVPPRLLGTPINLALKSIISCRLGKKINEGSVRHKSSTFLLVDIKKLYHKSTVCVVCVLLSTYIA